MARRLRLFFTDMPYHVHQRGNNREPIFFSTGDYAFFLEALAEGKKKYPCKIYSYCLMKNHFHLLLKPEHNRNNVSLLLKFLGAKYVYYVNRVYLRTGTLWQGRFKCSLVEGERYFLTCLRYIEMNPLRAGLVESPEQYRWSSYRVRAFGQNSDIVDLDPWFENLAPDPEQKRAAYRQFFAIEKCPIWDEIRIKTNKCGILGGEDFEKKIEQLTNKPYISK